MTALPMTLMSDEEVARFGRYDGAGFGALQTARGLLPLAAMDVDVRVVGTIASTELAQTFVNTTGVAIEATYIFPLPDRAAVTSFEMEGQPSRISIARSERHRCGRASTW